MQQYGIPGAVNYGHVNKMLLGGRRDVSREHEFKKLNVGLLVCFCFKGKGYRNLQVDDFMCFILTCRFEFETYFSRSQ